MEVRRIVEAEYDQVVELGGFAFQYTPDPAERERHFQRMRQSDIWGVFVDSRLASMMTVIPFETFVHGTALPTGGVAAVASWPEFRRQGHIRTMMTEALNEMRRKRQVLSNLFPFKQSFYAAFGWEPAGRRYRYTMPMSQCPRFGQMNGVVRPTDDHQELDAIQLRFAPSLNGTHKRDAFWWESRILRKEARACVYERDGQPEGYLIYQVKDFKFTAFEWVSLTADAHRALWNFIANHDSMAETIHWSGPADGRDLRYLPDPPKETQLALGHMSRIVDLEGFYRAAFPAIAGHSLRVALDDGQCAWNHGLWELGGENQITRLDTAIPNGHGYDLRCGTAALTAILLGTQGAWDLHQVGRLQGDVSAVAVLAEAFHTAPCISMDFY